jgi:hypothetical protein
MFEIKDHAFFAVQTRRAELIEQRLLETERLVAIHSLERLTAEEGALDRYLPTDRRSSLPRCPVQQGIRRST